MRRLLLALVDATGAGLWWLLRHAITPGLVTLGWATYVWASGRTWRHAVRRRYVRREVRAAGNWLVTAAVLGVVLAPAATVVVLALAAVGLIAAASTVRIRQRLGPGRGPIRVEAAVGDPIRRHQAEVTRGR